MTRRGSVRVWKMKGESRVSNRARRAGCDAMRCDAMRCVSACEMRSGCVRTRRTVEVVVVVVGNEGEG